MKEQDLHIGCSYRLAEKMGSGILTIKTRKDLLDAFQFFDYGLVEPIQIDADELKRLGFTKDENKDLNTIRLNEDYTLELTCNGFSNHEHGEYYVSIVGYFQQITFTKRYVHELQLLYFSLTGEFLTYKQ